MTADERFAVVRGTEACLFAATDADRLDASHQRGIRRKGFGENSDYGLVFNRSLNIFRNFSILGVMTTLQ
jgi:hypothetical protein